jgi:putative redox protein
MDIVVTFPGGKRVDAEAGGFQIRTDQPLDHGGGGSAPEPFTLFLASLATCAGIYVVGFCQARGIPTDGIRLVQKSESDPKTGRLVHVSLTVRVPASFPAQYRDAVARAAAACKVKKTLADPPALEVRTEVVDVAIAPQAA